MEQFMFTPVYQSTTGVFLYNPAYKERYETCLYNMQKLLCFTSGQMLELSLDYLTEMIVLLPNCLYTVFTIMYTDLSFGGVLINTHGICFSE